MADVFISHSSRNNVEAKQLFEWLVAQGYDPEQIFLDINDLKPGDFWRGVLDTLADCSAVAICLSDDWLSSSECIREFTQAQERKKFILPVEVAQPTLPIPRYFSDLQIGSFRTDAGRQALLRSLQNARISPRAALHAQPHGGLGDAAEQVVKLSEQSAIAEVFGVIEPRFESLEENAISAFLRSDAASSLILARLLSRTAVPIDRLLVTGRLSELLGAAWLEANRPRVEAAFKLYASTLDRLLQEEARRKGSPLFLPLGLAALNSALGVSTGQEGGWSEAMSQFVALYSRGADGDMPFGGRSAELDVLDTWLTDAVASLPLMIAGAAGSGKSALVVRWILRQFVQHSDRQCAIAFIPVSQRFQTHTSDAFFGLLASQLARVFQTAPPRMASAHELRNFCLSLMRSPPPDGRKLLLVLDGLDEAVGWNPGPDIFPSPLPPHMRVIASARTMPGDRGPADWVRRLGWSPRTRTLELHGLSLPDTLDLVERSSLQGIDARERRDLARRLFERTDGDPLLLSLWTSWIQEQQPSGRIDIDLVKDGAPGLGGLLATWWEQQRIAWGDEAPLRQASARALLALCAAAKGPLAAQDIMAVLPKLMGDRMLVMETARSLGRFVVGDANQTGYSICHPRLGAYIRDEFLSPSELTDLSEKLIGYCRNEVIQARALSGRRGKLSKYCVRHLGSHLWDSPHLRSELLTLPSRFWLEAWSATLGETAGFLADVSRAEATARDLGRWPDQIAAALVSSSFRSQGANLSSDLLVLAHKEGLINVATGVSLAQFQSETRDAARTMARLGANAEDTTIQRYAYQEAIGVSARSQDLATSVSLIECLPNEYKGIAASIALDTAERFRPWFRISWLSALARADGIPEELATTAFRLCESTAEEILKKDSGEYVVEAILPLIELFGSEWRGLFEIGIKHLPNTGTFRGGGLGRDDWTSGKQSTRKTKTVARKRYTQFSVLALKRLYSPSNDGQKARVRSRAMEMLNEMAGLELAEALTHANSFDLPAEMLKQLRARVLDGIDELDVSNRGDLISHVAAATPDEFRGDIAPRAMSALKAMEDKDYKKFFACLRMVESGWRNDEITVAMLRCAYAHSPGKDRSHYLTWTAKHLQGTERIAATEEAWRSGNLVDDDWYAGPCECALVCAASDSWPEIEAAVEREKTRKVRGEKSRDLDEDFWRSLVQSFLGNAAVLSSMATATRHNKWLPLLNWLQLFGRGQPWTSDEVLEEPFEPFLSDQRAALLELAAGMNGDPRLIAALTEMLETLRGEQRLRAIGFLVKVGALAFKDYEEEFMTARSGALAGYSAEEKCKRLSVLASALPEESSLRSDMFWEALEIAEAEGNGFTGAGCRSYLVKIAPTSLQHSLIETVLSICEKNGRHREGALVRIVPLATPQQLLRLVELAEVKFSKESIFGDIAWRWHELGDELRASGPSLLGDLITKLGRCQRSESMTALKGLVPLIRNLAGPEAVRATLRAVQRCRGDWP